MTPESTDEAQIVIRTHHLSKSFAEKTAVHNLNLSIPQGAIFGFIGPSGCGKTTTMRLLLGIYEPTAGEALIFDESAQAFGRTERERIGYMPQLFVLYPDLTVWENLNFVASLYGFPFRRKKRLRELLDLVELRGHEKKLVRHISGGMQRRLSLAAALVHNPELLFLDEPTAGIDPILRRKFWDYFQKLQAEGHTLFVVPIDSKITDLVEQYADSLGTTIEFKGITSDADEADRMLRQQEVDLVVVTPLDPYADVQNNEQAVFHLYHYEIDPFEETFIHIMGRRYAEAINKQILLTIADQGKLEAETMQAHVEQAGDTAVSVRQALQAGDGLAAQSVAAQLDEDVRLLQLAVGSGLTIFNSVRQTTGVTEPENTETVRARLEEMQDSLAILNQIDTDQADFDEEIEAAQQVEAALQDVDTLLEEFRHLDSDVLVSPFRSEILNITNAALEPTHFYVPAVIALLLQHLSITLAGLSIVRERYEGTMELFRAAPISAFETLVGKYLSYLLLTAVLGAVLTALVTFLLRVPMLGNWFNYALVLFALLFTSLGFGFLLSVTAQSNSQAIQGAMIILLASIFFSGFFLPLYRLATFVHVISWSLPATYGTTLLQDVMLRGQVPQILLILVLLGIGLILFLISWWRLKRMMAHE